MLGACISNEISAPVSALPSCMCNLAVVWLLSSCDAVLTCVVWSSLLPVWLQTQSAHKLVIKFTAAWVCGVCFTFSRLKHPCLPASLLAWNPVLPGLWTSFKHNMPVACALLGCFHHLWTEAYSSGKTESSNTVNLHCRVTCHINWTMI